MVGCEVLIPQRLSATDFQHYLNRFGPNALLETGRNSALGDYHKWAVNNYRVAFHVSLCDGGDWFEELPALLSYLKAQQLTVLLADTGNSSDTGFMRFVRTVAHDLDGLVEYDGDLSSRIVCGEPIERYKILRLFDGRTDREKGKKPLSLLERLRWRGVNHLWKVPND